MSLLLTFGPYFKILRLQFRYFFYNFDFLSNGIYAMRHIDFLVFAFKIWLS